ncbi:helix-turn-helix transcriptional regulator [Hyphomonas sp.]|uniref:helix-turn-helix domain-containing protein n=1 Tax=Hyphomonas sp. TaxID=87 RepID=UPI0025B9EBD6|nr:helix-turn-helix transcriptional regulator [Hyphomonas sp.]
MKLRLVALSDLIKNMGHLTIVMTPDFLREFLKSMGLKQADFGAWLAERLGQDRPYAPSEISTWEKGNRPVSYAVQAVIYKHLWESCR